MPRRWIGIGMSCLLGSGQCATLQDVLLRPSALVRKTPAYFNYSFESRRISADDGTQIGLWLVPTNLPPRKGILVIVPGNDANKGRYTPGLPLFVDNGWDVILFDYPGYGESDGEPTLDGLIEGTRAVIDYAKSQSDVVVGMGVSLGAPVLARVAADVDLSACIFESTVDVWHVASEFINLHQVPLPVGGLADLIAAAGTSPDFDTKRWVPHISSPKLFIHSPEDNFTPYQGAWELFQLAPEPKSFFTTRGEHALGPFLDPVLYRSVVNGWLDGVLNANPIVNEQFKKFLDEEVAVTLQEVGLAPPP